MGRELGSLVYQVSFWGKNEQAARGEREAVQPAKVGERGERV